ncbi:MAG: Si-specific NAD(P)(+) transhydrogenase [Candidatus Omnitrophica bacterium]|nr:putative soluble pyridine nucleotide transhydrogenase [bacterium]NUN95969.1 Si-specific NAD(P)(+) transhydrogenase [Candidatus Omnitrophota bacterium]
MPDYDMIVIGAGPAGQKAAVQAAKLNKRVAVIEREREVGGACVTTGTLPSKTLRETVQFLAGFRKRHLQFGDGPQRKKATMAQLLERKSSVVKHEIEIWRDQLERNQVEILLGEGSFIDHDTVQVMNRAGKTTRYTAACFVIATGSRPANLEGMPEFDPRVINSDTVLDLENIPATLAVLGGGVIGCEYACIFARLGSKVTLVDRRERLLRFMDDEITDTLVYHMREMDITLRLGEQFEALDTNPTEKMELRLASGKVIKCDRVMCAMGRTSNVETLNLDRVGIPTEGRTNLIKVNENYQTACSHIYAVGDVIGFPALASTSMEQGRLASCHAFGITALSYPESFPYGIYTIPEISYAGQNEQELTAKKIPYEIGRAEFGETARGQIQGDNTGMLKLLFHRESLELLGVHIIGEGATELVHIGQAVMAHHGKVTYFIDNVFNYPTLAECYKVAALNGINRL